jgi:hypothetical protein
MVNKKSRFLVNLWWFVNHWHPISVKWNSPRMLWKMAMRRDKIKDVIAKRKSEMSKVVKERIM